MKINGQPYITWHDPSREDVEKAFKAIKDYFLSSGDPGKTINDVYYEIAEKHLATNPNALIALELATTEFVRNLLKDVDDKRNTIQSKAILITNLRKDLYPKAIDKSKALIEPTVSSKTAYEKYCSYYKALVYYREIPEQEGKKKLNLLEEAQKKYPNNDLAMLCYFRSLEMPSPKKEDSITKLQQALNKFPKDQRSMYLYFKYLLANRINNKNKTFRALEENLTTRRLRSYTSNKTVQSKTSTSL